MLEELQRLQTQIGVLKTRLTHYESENNALSAAKENSAEHHHAQIVQKNGIITQKQEEIDNLSEQLSDAQSQFKQLNTDATSLADRYGRLEKVVPILKTVFRKFWLNVMNYAL